jgi:hypothetical protein
MSTEAGAFRPIEDALADEGFPLDRLDELRRSPRRPARGGGHSAPVRPGVGHTLAVKELRRPPAWGRLTSDATSGLGATG